MQNIKLPDYHQAEIQGKQQLSEPGMLYYPSLQAEMLLYQLQPKFGRQLYAIRLKILLNIKTIAMKIMS